MKKPVERLGIARLTKAQVSEVAPALDVQMAACRTDPLDALTENLPAVAARPMRPTNIPALTFSPQADWRVDEA